MSKSSGTIHDPASEAFISVVMPVHNAMPYLDEAIESILAQTHRNFEFVIYDDASTDGSAERLDQWSLLDRRIKLVHGERNLGPAASSNKVVEHASAPFIARMDADDISMPDRLERESAILLANQEAGLVASLCDVIDSGGRRIRGPELWRLVRKAFFTPFPHGSMMYRRALFDAVGGYRNECEFWEDLDFALRVSEKARILVLPRPLYRYRQSTLSTRIASDQDRVENALDLRYRSIELARRSRSYDDVLRDRSRAVRQRIDPRVFVSLGLLSLWSDRRPALLGRLFKRGAIRLDRASLVAILWLGWASVSPGSVRFTMNFVSRCRNAAVRPKLAEDEPVEWAPSKGVLPG